MEGQPLQRATSTIEPSQYGFAVMWNLEGAEPAVLLHRQLREKAEEVQKFNARFLVDVHGWKVVAVDGSTIHFTRPRPLDADEPVC